jgi:hypothetical protein
VRFYKLLHEGESGSGAFEGAALPSFDAMEAFEQARQFVHRNADPDITYLQLDVFSSGGFFQFNRDAASKGELKRIGGEIKDDLLPHIAVDTDLMRQILALNMEMDSGPFRGRSKIL